MKEQKDIILFGRAIWYGKEVIGEFNAKDYDKIITLFVAYGGCSRGGFQEVTALPTPGLESELIEQIKLLLHADDTGKN